METPNYTDPIKADPKFVDSQSKSESFLKPDPGLTSFCEPVSRRGRPRSKRSDPDLKPFSFYLRRSDHKKATAILLDRDDGSDLSDIIQGLLERWIAEQV